MANRQPGHHTFGLRTAEQIIGIYSMTESIVGEGKQSVYNTTFKCRQIAPTEAGSPTEVASFITPNQVILDGSGDTFYTGTVVTAYNAGTGYGNRMRLAKAIGDNERVIGVVVGGTGPTIANVARVTGTIQYSGEATILLQIGQSANIRGRFLELSSGVSGTTITNVSANVSQYGVCTTGGYASGMTGIAGLTGQYVQAVIRPIETN